MPDLAVRNSVRNPVDVVEAPLPTQKHRDPLEALAPGEDGVLDPEGGGHLGAELKYAGYDAVLITGKAPELSYLYIDPDKADPTAVIQPTNDHPNSKKLFTGSDNYGRTDTRIQQLRTYSIARD